MRSPFSYDYRAIVRNKVREGRCYAKHAALLTPYACLLGRDAMKAAAALLVLLVLALGLAAVHLVRPGAFRTFVEVPLNRDLDSALALLQLAVSTTETEPTSSARAAGG